ncbi:hypothetical protein [Hymenobacter psychrophilus]|uniref:hypothetical protein n=1 Tax=Hymenobacter psychrophilus TaxID=651662 RepID=UPI001114CF9D|nr:hypothetical protein [Hymenobacter psychrophilus]
MKISHLLSWALLATTTGLTLTSCTDNAPEPDLSTVYVPQNVPFQLGMKGYMNSPQIIARFGVAKSASDAREGNGTELRDIVRWTDTQGGKIAKEVVLPNQKSGTTRWVYLSLPVKPTGDQSVSVSWPTAGAISLNAASTDTIVFREITIP